MYNKKQEGPWHSLDPLSGHLSTSWVRHASQPSWWPRSPLPQHGSCLEWRCPSGQADSTNKSGARSQPGDFPRRDFPGVGSPMAPRNVAIDDPWMQRVSAPGRAAWDADALKCPFGFSCDAQSPLSDGCPAGSATDPPRASVAAPGPVAPRHCSISSQTVPRVLGTSNSVRTLNRSSHSA